MTQCIPELRLCRGARLVERHAFGAQLVDAFGEMKVELAIDVALDPCRAERVGETLKPGHRI